MGAERLNFPLMKVELCIFGQLPVKSPLQWELKGHLLLRKVEVFEMYLCMLIPQILSKII